MKFVAMPLSGRTAKPTRNLLVFGVWILPRSETVVTTAWVIWTPFGEAKVGGTLGGHFRESSLSKIESPNLPENDRQVSSSRDLDLLVLRSDDSSGHFGAQSKQLQ